MATTFPHLLMAARFSGDRDCPWHVHAGHELVLVTAGRCRITCGDRDLAGGRGTVFILPRGQPQYQHGGTPVRTSYLTWEAGDAFLAPGARTIAVDLRGREARWIEDCCDLCADAGRDPSIADGILLALLRSLAAHEGEQQARDAMHPALVLAGDHIVRDLRAPLDVAALATAAGVSPSHLTRLFRAQHRCGPLRYQQGLRLRLAQRLLQDPALGVAEVARRCGYDDLNYFCRLFRQRVGSPPATWRGTRRAQGAKGAARR